MDFYYWFDPLLLSLAFWFSFFIGVKIARWFSHLKDLSSWRFGILFLLALVIIPIFCSSLHSLYYSEASHSFQDQLVGSLYKCWGTLGASFGFCFSFNRHAVDQNGYVLFRKEFRNGYDFYEVAFTGICQDSWRYNCLLRPEARMHMKLDTSLEFHRYHKMGGNRSLCVYFDQRELDELSAYLSLDEEQNSLLREYFYHPALVDLKISRKSLAEHDNAKKA